MINWEMVQLPRFCENCGTAHEPASRTIELLRAIINTQASVIDWFEEDSELSQTDFPDDLDALAADLAAAEHALEQLFPPRDLTTHPNTQGKA